MKTPVPVTKKLQQALLLAGIALDHVRVIGAKVAEQVGRAPDPRLRPEIAAQEAQAAKEAAKREAQQWLNDQGTMAAIDEMLDQEEDFTLSVFVRRASFAQGNDPALIAQLSYWCVELPRCDSDELKALLHDALATVPTPNLALAGSIVRELKLRARADDAGIDERGDLHLALVALNEIQLPELVEVRRGMELLREVRGWINSAVTACSTLNDGGIRDQHRWRLQLAGTNGPFNMGADGLLSPQDMPTGSGPQPPAQPSIYTHTP